MPFFFRGPFDIIFHTNMDYYALMNLTQKGQVYDFTRQ